MATVDSSLSASLPRLALIEPSLTGETLEPERRGSGRLAVPPEPGRARDTVTVRRDSFPAVDQGDEAAAWLSSSAAAIPPRLGALRPLRSAAIATRTFAGDIGSAYGSPDAYPLLILSECIAGRSQFARLAEPLLPMNRFRPNVGAVRHRRLR